MPDSVEFVVRIVLIGAGATALLDLWAVLAARLFAMPLPNWGLVGRWIGYFPRGRFVHDSIAKAAPVRGEVAIGWVAHYAIGILYAAVLVTIWGVAWARHPTPLPALAVGLVALAAPFFIMQPGMGAGVAASRTPNPGAARLRSLVTHTLFSLGLYASAGLSAWLVP